MLSICIPVYNTDCTKLLKAIHREKIKLTEKIEVIVVDDYSKKFQVINQKVCQNYDFRYIQNSTNLGRVATRLKLANESTFNWLLFLDSDMMPASENFIKQYLEAVETQQNAVIVGGCCYDKSDKLFNLRLRYGLNRESKTAATRNKNPFNYVFFGNLALQKNVFVMCFNSYETEIYGEDIYLSAFLKKKKIRIHHIDNNAFHHGIESNKIFIHKIEDAAISLSNIYKDSAVDLSHNKLIFCFELLKKYNLSAVTQYILMFLSPIMRNTMLWLGGPIFFIDFYRLYHFLKNC